MNLNNQIKKGFLTMAVLVPLLWSMESMAGSTTLVLKRNTLQNVNDAAGLWQYDAGQVFQGTTQVGYYQATNRVTTKGGAVLNAAAETITVFLDDAQLKGSAPRNITLEGAHDYSSGNFQGSVSAASSQYSWIKGANASGNYVSTGILDLTINWLESDTLTLP
ncbi:hypothetical protein [Methylomonas sp. AM2-LC]|uniref:hypothetical protein n=1 Tax=Methylomonas sp. AM2-LC TaxID=3153301 RepID=UPI0032667366